MGNGPRLVKCHFNQPGKKRARYVKRQEKAAKLAPMPTAGSLRPVVRCQTNKYNLRQRAGRGFTLQELKAGYSPKQAQAVGIAVDHRRTNKSLESLQANVQRLEQYKAKLVILNKKRAGHTEAQLKGFILPLAKPSLREKARAVTAEEKKRTVFQEMRIARANERLIGSRQRRDELKAAEEAMKKK